MTVARSLAEFLTQVSYADLPPQTVEHAAMLHREHDCQRRLGLRDCVLGDHPCPRQGARRDARSLDLV